jgi:hypothetical protein
VVRSPDCVHLYAGLTICRYGDYQKYPEEPYVGSLVYAPNIYNSWDPNWRGFIGTTLIIAIEEYEHLLSEATTNLVLESLHNATKGDEYRVGGVDDDNLYPAYSNPVSAGCCKVYRRSADVCIGYHAGLHVWLDWTPLE